METIRITLETPEATPIRQFLTTATPDQLSARFGRNNAKRTEQIAGILETVRGRI